MLFALRSLPPTQRGEQGKGNCFPHQESCLRSKVFLHSGPPRPSQPPVAHSALCACVGRAQVPGVTGNTSSEVAADPSPAALVQRTGLNQLECLLFLVAKPMGHISYQNVSGEQRCRRERELGGRGLEASWGDVYWGHQRPRQPSPVPSLCSFSGSHLGSCPPIVTATVAGHQNPVFSTVATF